MKKVLSIAIMVVMLLTVVSSSVFALNPASIKGNTDDNTPGVSSIKEIGGDILGLVQIAGSVVAVIILAVIGVKYMMGSAEEKAEYKKTFIPYIVGAVLIFAASNLAGLVYTWASSIGNP